MIGGYDRTSDCRYVHPTNPSQLWVSKARVSEVNPQADALLMADLESKGIGPKPNRVNCRLTLYKVDEIAKTDFNSLTTVPVPEQASGVSEQVHAIRILNDAIRAGTLVVTQKPDGTLRALVEVG